MQKQTSSENMFFFVAAATYQTNHINQVFGYHFNHIFRVWDLDGPDKSL
jgi:hypothetical protein